jgi:hypothetical protein
MMKKQIACLCEQPVYASDLATGIHWACGFPLPGGPFLIAQDIAAADRKAGVPYDIAHMYCYQCLLPVEHIADTAWRCPAGHTEQHPWMKEEQYA